jgi:hypothetical protein
MVKYNMEITFSKFMALLILICGVLCGLLLNNPGIVMLSLGICGSVIGAKQFIDKEKVKFKTKV